MAGGLTFSPRPWPVAALACALAAGLGLGAGRALGQTPLPDPTRPPAAFAAEPGKAASEPAASGLQAVIMRPGRKPMAVINGTTVLLGGKLGDQTLIRLSESEAVLQGPAGRVVLRLTPGAAMRLVNGKRGEGGGETSFAKPEGVE